MRKKSSNNRRFKRLVRYIKKYFSQNPKEKMAAGQLQKRLNLPNSKEEISKVLDLLEDQKIIRHQGKGKFKYYKETAGSKYYKNDKRTEGYVDMTLSGSAYITGTNIEDDIFIASKNLNGAFHGDLVELSYYYPRRRRRPEGKVIRVKERASEIFIGTISNFKKYSIVFVERNRSAIEIYIHPEDTMDAENGEIVVIQVTQWPSREGQSPVGVVKERLGHEAGNDFRMKTILVNNGFNLDFPEAVIQESEAISEVIDQDEIDRRKDIREVLTFTIDPKDAKDFDDALSYQRLENGNLEVGVHIADVSHYIKVDSALDKEAFRRSTSVYLVDRVLPMLPEKLSNQLCSLRPNEDKLAYSVLFEFDEEHQLKNKWIGRTVIHSDHRFNYSEAQEIIDGKEDEFSEVITHLHQIAQGLRSKRFQNGSINFSSEEVRFEIDENGTPIDAYVKESGASNQLIEEFMLLANQAVSLFIRDKKQSPAIPFIYRIHDLPDEDKLYEIAQLAADLGIEINVETPEKISHAFNKITGKAEEDPIYKILSHLAIRSMAKAEYSSDNIGHYGLGFSHYTHFTSPIRRYSDVIAHRLLFKNKNQEVFRTNKAALEEKCEHISRQERKAIRAERESIKLKQVEYVDRFKGQVVEGTISGMIEKGIFVEVLKSKSEGLVSFDQFGERFELGGTGATAVGISSGRKLRIGDHLQVKIVETDIVRRQIELRIEDENL